MKRCRTCRVPLEGRWAGILQKILRIKPSQTDPGLCNKCTPRKTESPATSNYICRICNRPIDEKHALSHVKAEEYLLKLIRRDHPEWKEEEGACPQCLDYYRRLIKETQI